MTRSELVAGLEKRVAKLAMDVRLADGLAARGIVDRRPDITKERRRAVNALAVGDVATALDAANRAELWYACAMSARS